MSDTLLKQQLAHKRLMQHKTISEIDGHIQQINALLRKLGRKDARFGGCFFGSLHMKGKDGVSATHYEIYQNADTDLVKGIIERAGKEVEKALSNKTTV